MSDFLPDSGERSYKKSYIITDLSPEILTEILLRLPVRCLLICKSVSKSFLNLLKSPYFIHQQLCRTKNHHVQSLLLDVCLDVLYGRNHPFIVSIDKNTNHIISHSFLHQIFPVVGFLSIFGSCNGLLCGEIVTHDHDFERLVVSVDDTPWILMWNPATRQSRYLPKLQLPYFPCYIVDLEFGFVPEPNDYKVVCIIVDEDDDWEIHVYKMSTDCWTIVDFNLPSDVSSMSRTDLLVSETSVFLNGAFHWGVAGWDHTCSCILSFNLKDEEVGSFRVLDTGSCYDGNNWSLAVIDESLAVIYMERGVDVWVMNKYGVEDSWTLRYRVNDGIPNGPCSVMYWTNCLVVVGFGTNLRALLYVLNTRETKELLGLEELSVLSFMNQLPTWQATFLDTFFSYMETLIPVGHHTE